MKLAISVGLPSSPIKICKANRSRVSRVMIGHTNRQTDKQRLQLFIYFLTIFFFFNYKKVFIKDSYKLLHYYFNSITVFQYFPLWDSGPSGGRGIESQDPENPKWETQHPNIYLWYFQNYWYQKLSVHSSYLFIDSESC